MSSFTGYLKRKNALWIFDKHANLQYKFENRHFWLKRYYVSEVELNKVTIKNIYKIKKSMIKQYID